MPPTVFDGGRSFDTIPTLMTHAHDFNKCLDQDKSRRKNSFFPFTLSPQIFLSDSLLLLHLYLYLKDDGSNNVLSTSLLCRQ